MRFPNRSDTNRSVQAQEMARDRKFQIKKEEELYYQCSGNKGADQLRSYCKADVRLCFRICKMLFFFMTRLRYIINGNTIAVSGLVNASDVANIFLTIL